MNIWDNIISYFNRYLTFPNITVIDIIEIVIIAFCFYKVMIWFKKTRAWSLFKGIIIILVIVLLAAIFNFNTILWIASKVIGLGVIAIVIIFQPELRRALESLGRRSVFSNFFSVGSRGQSLRFSNETMEEILRATAELASEHTGALICMERDVSLAEYEGTGIAIDAVVSSQLIQNIFEDKTPLHDGAVIIRDDRIVSATSYLPMSTSQDIGKQFGTRHRAGKGISEVTDSFTIIVSEETGSISYAYLGEFVHNVSEADLKNKMIEIQGREVAEESFFSRIGSWFKNLGKEDESDEKVSDDTKKLSDK